MITATLTNLIASAFTVFGDNVEEITLSSSRPIVSGDYNYDTGVVSRPERESETVSAIRSRSYVRDMNGQFYQFREYLVQTAALTDFIPQKTDWLTDGASVQWEIIAIDRIGNAAYRLEVRH